MNALVGHKAFDAATSASTTSARASGALVSLFDFQPVGGKVHQIRVVEIGGEPWFVAVDLYATLYDRTTGLSFVDRILNEDEKRVLLKSEVREFDTLSSLFSLRGQYRLALISESGLYKLILRSDKSEAKPFQDWVTREVLPAIRKDGGYIVGEEKVASGEMSEDELVLRAL